jgi:RNA polymerase sigma-70 factor (ECF subfamily)
VQLLYRCIQELPGLDRAVILMQLEQKSYQEIADVTGLSEGNVSVRIVRIKQKLRTMLEQRGYKGEKCHE